jgi:uncharacterized protein YdeI (BOF family)
MKYKIGDKVLVMGELITIIEKIENGKYYFRDKENKLWHEVEDAIEIYKKE